MTKKGLENLALGLDFLTRRQKRDPSIELHKYWKLSLQKIPILKTKGQAVHWKKYVPTACDK